MKRIGFYAGSFDPFTVGHLYVVKNALTLFDSVIIGIAHNPDKPNRRFDIKVMEAAIQKAMIDEELKDKVKVISYSGLTFKAARKNNATHLIRGLRNGMDYEYEDNLAHGNKKIGGYETLYFRSDSDFDYISSSVVTELFKDGEDISKFVPKAIFDVITNL